MTKKSKSRIFLETKCPGLLEALERIQEMRRQRRGASPDLDYNNKNVDLDDRERAIWSQISAIPGWRAACQCVPGPVWSDESDPRLGDAAKRR